MVLVVPHGSATDDWPLGSDHLILTLNREWKIPLERPGIYL